MKTDNGAIVCMLVVLLMFYCVPMLKRMDELESELIKIRRQLEEIKKALYVIPEDEDDSKRR